VQQGVRSAQAAVRLRLGDWLVEPAMNQISRGAEVVRLEPKVVEVLAHLARHADQVVSREELLSEVWKGVIVGDDALTQGVIKLRKALGDTSNAPSYILTIPKRGYRLIAPVAWLEAEAGPRSEVVQATGEKPRVWWSRNWLVGTGAVALAVGLMIIWLLVQSKSHQVPTLTDIAATTAFAKAIDELPTVVVRSFKEIEGEPSQSLLARGLTAHLIMDLGRLPDIRVISAPTPDTYAEETRTTNASAGRYVVTGEVQRSAEMMRIYINVAEAASGRSLWSESYDRPYADILVLQDELIRQVLGVLPVKVGEAELRRRARPYTRNLEAYEYFMRAQSALILRRLSDNSVARDLYTKAIQLDPTFARAFAGLALTHAADHRYNWTKDGAAALAKAVEIATMAQQMDPDIPEVYFALAYVDVEQRKLSDAADYVRTALRLNPSYADAYALLGAIQTYIGRPSETIPLLRVAMRLSPHNGHLYFMIIGRAYFHLGDTAAALLNLREAITRNPASLETRIYLAATLARDGQRSAATWEAEEIRTLESAFRIREWLKNHPMSDVRQAEQLITALGTVGF